MPTIGPTAFNLTLTALALTLSNESVTIEQSVGEIVVLGSPARLTFTAEDVTIEQLLAFEIVVTGSPARLTFFNETPFVGRDLKVPIGRGAVRYSGVEVGAVRA